MAANVVIDRDRIVEFCQKWRIREFALFGSVLRDDFRPDSDVDVLVTFDDVAPWTTFDLVQMQDELRPMFGRNVDLVEKRTITNPFRRHAILTGKEVVYAA
jgi:predicted nucleotidyltransferase